MGISTDDLGRITQQTSVLGSDGGKLGTINQIYTSDTTGDPAWVTVKTGLFGGQESFVPLKDASFEGDDVHVPFTKKDVHDAPRVDADGHLGVEEEDDLYRYYGIQHPAHAPADGGVDTGTDAGAQDDAAGVAAGTAGAAAAVTEPDRDDELAQRDVEGRDEVADPVVPEAGQTQEVDRSVHAEDGPELAAPEQAAGTTAQGPGGNDDDAVTPGERTTRLRRYVVTERVVRTVEELPDEPSR